MLTNLWRRHFNWLLFAVVLAGLISGAALAAATRSSPRVAVQSTSAGIPSAAASGQTGEAQGQPAAGGAGAVARPLTGSVAEIGADAITVRGSQGDAKVKLAGAKIVRTAEGTTGDLTPGQRVAVVATQEDGRGLTATSVQIGQAGQADRVFQEQGGQGQQGASLGGGTQARGQNQQGAEPRSRVIAGTVTSLDGGVLAVTTQQGEVKVNLGSARIQKTVEATGKDLQVGQRVVVTGQPTPDGSYGSAEIQIVAAGDGASGGTAAGQ